MDDPWVSPWASNDTSTNNTHEPFASPSPPKSLLSPPPRAFFGSNNGSHGSLPGSSPWADDGGFGDWATGEQDEGSSSPGWGTWNETSFKSTQLASTPDGDNGELSWPGKIATLASPKRSQDQSIPVVRQPSPDPWATEWSAADEPSRSPPSSTEINTEISVTPIANTPKLQPDLQDTASTIEAPLHDSSIHDIEADDVDLTEGAITQSIESNPEIQISDEPSTPRSPKSLAQDVEQPETAADVPESVSRPSSTFSTDAQPEPERPESPITSIDEEPRPQNQVSQRKPSGKVAELVDKFDGIIARLAVDESPRPQKSSPRTSSFSRSRGADGEQEDLSSGEEDEDDDDDDGDFGDFGDFEDAEDDSTDDNFLDVATPASDRASTPKAKLREDFPRDGSTDTERAKYKTPAPDPSTVPVQSLVERFGTVIFDVDQLPFDKLFSDLPETVTQESSDEHLDDSALDRIITDSFTSISERKSWYRLSRNGSMRMHNMGDDENYTRVAWPASNVRGETIKIVRRWMEEDSITGKSTLGGVGKRTSVFDWDSSAPGMELEKAFRRRSSSSHSKKKSMQRTRRSSQASNSSTAAAPAAEAPDTSQGTHDAPKDILASPVAPIATFGWSSSVPEDNEFESKNDNAETSARSSLSLPKPPTAAPMPTLQPTPMAGTKDEKRPDALKLPPALSLAIPQQAAKSKAPVQVTDDDDEWGEMVASPSSAPQQGFSNDVFGNDTIPVRDSGNTAMPNATPLQPTKKVSFSMPPNRDGSLAKSMSPLRSTASFSPEIIPSPSQQQPPQPATSILPNLDGLPEKSPFQSGPGSVVSQPTPTYKSQVPPFPSDPSTQSIDSSSKSHDDPWASVDFSFFDTPGASTPAPTSTSQPYSSTADQPAQLDKTLQSAAVPRSSNTPISKVVLGPIQEKGAAEQEKKQEAIIKSIVQNLPDLSYMLR